MKMSKRGIDLNGKRILVTGSPGFIGSNLVMRLLNDMKYGSVISLDNMNDYYDVELKRHRLLRIEKVAEKSAVDHVFIEGDIADKRFVENVFQEYKFDVVVHLAAQAGVRYSIDHPDKYIESNIIGFYNVLEAVRGLNDYSEGNYKGVSHFVFASSSSVYGESRKTPFSIDDKTDCPVSLYAATKKSDEVLAYSYAKLYGIPTTGIRFFTVYGPAGRPDMFYYKAAKRFVDDEIVYVYNHGKMKRDFTFIDDTIEGICRVMQNAPIVEETKKEGTIPAFCIYNMGGGQPVDLLDFLHTLQEELILSGVLPQSFDFEAHTEKVGMQAGDVPVTYADSELLEKDFGFKPSVGIREGLKSFAKWYAEYHGG